MVVLATPPLLLNMAIEIISSPIKKKFSCGGELLKNVRQTQTCHNPKTFIKPQFPTPSTAMDG
jgi:hypothetical protein